MPIFIGLSKIRISISSRLFEEKVDLLGFENVLMPSSESLLIKNKSNLVITIALMITHISIKIH